MGLSHSEYFQAFELPVARYLIDYDERWAAIWNTWTSDGRPVYWVHTAHPSSSSFQILVEERCSIFEWAWALTWFPCFIDLGEYVHNKSRAQAYLKWRRRGGKVTSRERVVG